MASVAEDEEAIAAVRGLWGRSGGPTQIPLPADCFSKTLVRQKVWEFMEKSDVAAFPRPVSGRIPNFRGSAAAAQRLARQEEFAKAKVVKVSPDKPQEEVRFLALEQRKDLLVPTPNLAKGLFNRLAAAPGASAADLRRLAIRQGVDRESKPVPAGARVRVDLLVVGSTAVAADSGRRIGKGEGYADLEWALALSPAWHGGRAVGEHTIVAATVHDCQVFDSLPEELFGPHDLPVDLIVTPTRVIRPTHPSAKPVHGVIWALLDAEKVSLIPALQEARFKEERWGKDVRVKEEILSPPPDMSTPPPPIPTSKSNGEMSSSHFSREKFVINGHAQQSAWRSKEPLVDADNRHELSIFLGLVPRYAHPQDLKEAMAARGVHATGLNGLSLFWKGGAGYAFLNVDENVAELTHDQVLKRLKGMR